MRIFSLALLALLAFSSGSAHDGMNEIALNESVQSSQPAVNYLYWVGIIHPMIIHFPIALIFVAALAEILYLLTKKNIYSCAGEFAIVCAAIAIVPTVLTGLAFAYSADYTGKTAVFLWWHQYLGLFTALMTLAAAYIRECDWKEGQSRGLYYLFLGISFMTVSLTAFLGGEMAWGYPFSDLLMNN